MVSRERVKIKGSCGLTWLKSKDVRQCQGLCIQHSDHFLIDITSSLKIGFQASFDSACLHFTPLDLRFTPLLSLSSSRLISIFDKSFFRTGPTITSPKCVKDEKVYKPHFAPEFGGFSLEKIGEFRLKPGSRTKFANLPDLAMRWLSTPKQSAQFLRKPQRCQKRIFQRVRLPEIGLEEGIFVTFPFFWGGGGLIFSWLLLATSNDGGS